MSESNEEVKKEGEEVADTAAETTTPEAGAEATDENAAADDQAKKEGDAE